MIPMKKKGISCSLPQCFRHERDLQTGPCLDTLRVHKTKRFESEMTTSVAPSPLSDQPNVSSARLQPHPTPAGELVWPVPGGASIWLLTLAQVVWSLKGVDPAGTLGAVSPGELSARPNGASIGPDHRNPSSSTASHFPRAAPPLPS